MATERDVHTAYWAKAGVAQNKINAHWRKRRPLDVAASIAGWFIILMAAALALSLLWEMLGG